MDIQKAEHGFPIVSFTQQITRLGWLSIVLLLRIADRSVNERSFVSIAYLNYKEEYF